MVYHHSPQVANRSFNVIPDQTIICLLEVTFTRRSYAQPSNPICQMERIIARSDQLRSPKLYRTTVPLSQSYSPATEGSYALHPGMRI
jgi:hypothetical protein